MKEKKEKTFYNQIILDCIVDYCKDKPYKIYYQNRFGKFFVQISDTKKLYYGYLNELLTLEIKLIKDKLSFTYDGQENFIEDIKSIIRKAFAESRINLVVEQN